MQKDAIQALDRDNILYHFPAIFNKGRTVVVLNRPKTRSSIRTVYLTLHMIDLLRNWKKAQTPCGKNIPDLILRYSSDRPLQEETLPRILERQLLTVGLPKVTFYSLRHPYVKHTTKNIILKSRNPKLPRELLQLGISAFIIL